MKAPTYSKEMRDRAKHEGKHLYTIDFVRPDGTRELTAQGPVTKEQGRILAEAWGKMLRKIGREAKRCGECAGGEGSPQARGAARDGGGEGGT